MQIFWYNLQMKKHNVKLIWQFFPSYFPFFSPSFSKHKTSENSWLSPLCYTHNYAFRCISKYLSCSKEINIFFNQLPQQVEETIECPLIYRKVSKPQWFQMRRMEYLLSTLWHDWMLSQLSGSRRRQGIEVSQRRYKSHLGSV